MDVITYSFNLDSLPEMSYGVLECNSVVTELHVYDFLIKEFVIKEGRYLCQTLGMTYYRKPVREVW